MAINILFMRSSVYAFRESVPGIRAAAYPLMPFDGIIIGWLSSICNALFPEQTLPYFKA